MSYHISYSDGRDVYDIESYEAAIEIIMAEYPAAEIGHDGDLRDGGDRTLCWPDEESSRDDAGQNAIASIRRRD